MRRRVCPRLPVQCAVQFRGTHVFGGGLVLDISEGGAKIVGDTGITPGMLLALQIHLVPHALPVKVEAAAVRWVRGHEFGLEFTSILDKERSRLRGFAMKA